MTIVAPEQAVLSRAPRTVLRRPVRIALLGLGQVGGAIAAIAGAPASHQGRFLIASTLVRDLQRPRSIDTGHLALTASHREPLRSRPDVVVEVLGGCEPARTLVLSALHSGIPVVTANKSLLAACGDELFAAAAAARVPLLYEASVLAGVPFLGTFARRPIAGSAITGLRGIVNGTSNFIVSRMAHERSGFQEALAAAQRAGYAEPDPAKDIDGDDAVEKLCVLLRHFAGFSVAPSQIDHAGISGVDIADIAHASTFGGAVRPVVQADWTGDGLSAYAGPAYVAAGNALCRVDGVQNAIALTTAASGELFFGGPGAGPEVTAATVLDDVIEAAAGASSPIETARPAAVSRLTGAGWFLRISSSTLAESDAPGLLASLGVRLRRASHVDARGGEHSQWLLTHPCSRAHLAAALQLVTSRTGCRHMCLPVLQ
jgi:homoserine dehydrogenase